MKSRRITAALLAVAMLAGLGAGSLVSAVSVAAPPEPIDLHFQGASVSVDGEEVLIELADDGKSGTVDLSALADDARVTGGSVTVNVSSVLTLTGISDLPAGHEYGDANNDGEINVMDAIATLRLIVGLPNTVMMEKVVDVNADDKVNVMDAIAILRSIVGLLDEFGAETQINALLVDELLMSQDLTGGEAAPLELSEWLGILDPQGDGVSLGTLRNVFGENLTIYGTLTPPAAAAADVVDVVLEVKLAAPPAVDV